MSTPQSYRATTAEQIDECSRLLKVSIPKEGWRITFTPWREHRSLSQNAFQHVIYQEISKYLINKGRTDCSPEWVKDMLKNKFLGWVQREFTDVVTGKKTVHEVLRPTAALDVGEAYQYTTEILDWAQSIGCDIKIPANSEYMKLREAQNK
ncbi:MAG: hypothetical protein C4586_08485 [Anaerolineaceae bacterium]|nr:MAG: hypothetical protein C4586_08485 [Anaerolineaceae bacterium]